MEPNAMDRTGWMRGRWGVMTHWLFPGVLPERGAPAGTLDEAVDAFNVGRLLEDVEATGASWLLLTLGQNTGSYISPNPVIEELAGPGHCSRRDLALEIAQGVHALGKRFIAYLPCEVAANTSLHEGFSWNRQEGTDQAAFQQRYTQAVAAWSMQMGPALDGWWFDGCYTWPVFHNRFMDWDLWLGAARAGGSERPAAFNDGSFCIGKRTPVFAAQDYLSGEVEMLAGGQIRLGRDPEVQRAPFPNSPFVPGTSCQWHALLPVDCFWMHGAPAPQWLPGSPYPSAPAGSEGAPMEPPLYSDEALRSFLAGSLAGGGAVTLNVGTYQEGHMGVETVRQLARVGRAL